MISGASRCAASPASGASRVRRRAPFVLFGAVVALVVAVGVPAYATPTDRVTADEPQYLLSALSLGRDLDLDIADEVEGDAFRDFHPTDLPPQAVRVGDGDPLISPHEPGLPVLLALPVRVGGWVAAKAVLAGAAGALAGLTAWVAVARLGVRRRTALLVVGGFALSVPLAAYGTQVYPEVPAALLVMLAVASLPAPSVARAERSGPSAPATRAMPVPVVTAAVAAAALPWLSVKYVPLAVALALGAGWAPAPARAGCGAGRTGGRAVPAVRTPPVLPLTVLPLVASVVGLLAVGRRVHGGCTAYGATGRVALTDGPAGGGGDPALLAHLAALMGRSRRLVGLLVDDTFGLAAWSPAWLLLPLALGLLVGSLRPGARGGAPSNADPVARAAPPGAAAVLPVVVPLAVGWLVATFVAPTMHGWWAPGRQVVVVAPLGALVVAWAVDRHPGLRRPFVVAAAIGVVTWVWSTIEAVTRHGSLVVDLGSTTNPWFRLWRTVLPDGRSGLGADEALLVAWLAVVAALFAGGVGARRRARVPSSDARWSVHLS